jgi:glutathione-regulated potassium-efflux system ancillary protein KefG
MPNKILILFAHPLFEKSRVNRSLVRQRRHVHHITFHDLYEVYPDYNIDIEHEKKLLLNHDVIVWHHPFYWYSCPPLLKQWIDMVLEVGWAYGPGGTALTGKKIVQVITTGGPGKAYTKEGNNRFTIREFLIPFEQTAVLCHMQYLPPMIIQGTHRLSEDDIKEHGNEYQQMLEFLAEKYDGENRFNEYKYFNEILKSNEQQ